MAGDWIKMRVGLTTHPRVRRIAECLLHGAAFLTWSGLSADSAQRNASLRVTRYVTVTALLRFWGYANEHAKGEMIDGVWPEDVDDVTGIPGFGDAIEAAGWVAFDRENGTLTMPNFEEHNVSATERGSTSAAERQRRYRERKKAEAIGPNGDVTRDVTVTHREEKRTEELTTTTTTPDGVVVASAAGAAPHPQSKASRPDCPHRDIIALYHEILPECPQVRDWTPARAQQLRARWNEDPRRQNLDYWRQFFEYVKTCGFLVGRSTGKGDRPFVADLEWLTKSKNFTKVREGRYE